MSKTIWKYTLPRDGQVIYINEKIIEVLHIDCQDGYPTAWIVVDPEATCYPTSVVAWGTGWDLPDDVYFNSDYWGTCEDGAGYVWHYFAEESDGGEGQLYDTNTITTEWSNGELTSAAPSEWLSGSMSNIVYPQATLTTSSQGVTINKDYIIDSTSCIDGVSLSAEESLSKLVEKIIEEQGISAKRYVCQ